MNMSYCRFENTVSDISDCIHALEDGNWDIEAMAKNASSEFEARAMKHFVYFCKKVAEKFPNDES